MPPGFQEPLKTSACPGRKLDHSRQQKNILPSFTWPSVVGHGWIIFHLQSVSLLLKCVVLREMIVCEMECEMVKFLRDATGLSSNKFFQGALVYNGVCCSMFLHVGYSWGTTLPFYNINHCSVASISPMQPYSALVPPYSYLEQFAWPLNFFTVFLF